MAPVIIFCYNRLRELETMISSLQKNTLAKVTDVYVFCDGPKNDEDKLKTDAVRSFVHSLKGFHSVNIRESKLNKGLASSVIAGVNEIFEIYDCVIVLEDDLILSNNFLSWMNQCLSFYEDNKQVFSLSGFSPSVSSAIANEDLDMFFNYKAHSWGWATWKNRWIQIDWKVKDWEQFSVNKTLQKKFNTLGSEMTGLLFDFMSGKKSSWWIRLCYTQFKLQKYTVYPILSKVINGGFSIEATNCNVYNRYYVDFDVTNKDFFRLLETPKINKKIDKKFFSYYSLRARIIGRMKTQLLRWRVIKQYTVKD